MSEIKNILVLTTWAYKEGLIQSSTIPYLRMIHEASPQSTIYLATQEKQNWKREETTAADKKLADLNAQLIPQRYYPMGVKKIFLALFQFFQLWWLAATKNVSHIHAFCTPAGATGYLLSVLTGKKLILDSYEPHAGAMLENGTWTKKSAAYKILSWFEKKQTERASFCLNAASGMEVYAAKNYGVQLKKFAVRPCCVNLQMFQYNADAALAIRNRLHWNHKIVCVYAGKFGGIYLDIEVFNFFRVATQFWGDKFRVLLLTALTQPEIEMYCKNSGLPLHVIHATSIPFAKMPEYLSVADFGFTPVKPVPSKRYCSPIKDGEYWAIGLPVVITQNISDDSAIIEANGTGAVLQSLNDEAYLRAIKKIDALLPASSLLKHRIRKIAEDYRNYDIAHKIYRNIYGTNFN